MPLLPVWLHARELHMGADEARMHTALMYTDDVVLAAVGTDRIVALLRAWRKVTGSVGLTMAIPGWLCCPLAGGCLRRGGG
eukprot:3330921-Pleurochrysis_carterae.AAC.1